MPWKTMDVEEQKVRFVVAATRQEKSFSALCQEFGVWQEPGRWLRRGTRPSRRWRVSAASDGTARRRPVVTFTWIYGAGSEKASWWWVDPSFGIGGMSKWLHP
jgi:hypothetical protein